VKLLLDTQIWIWSLLDPRKLTDRVAKALESPDNEIWLSPISVWELLILVEKGKIALDREPAEWLAMALDAAPVREAPLTLEIAQRSRTIDLPHQDPADRFIAATAAVHGFTLVTSDGQILGSKELSLLANR
jgi:PIN domain nuclease of toxin-antitoxin system